MAKRIITISREFGSGGRFIGEEVANNLDYHQNISKKMQNYHPKEDFLPMHFQVVILQENPWMICCMRHREK